MRLIDNLNSKKSSTACGSAGHLHPTSSPNSLPDHLILCLLRQSIFSMDDSSPPSFADLQTSLQRSLVALTRASNALGEEDLSFYRNLDPSLARELDAHNARLLGLAQRFLNGAAAGTQVTAPRIPDQDALEGSFPRVVDVLDSLLENTDSSIDEFTGAVRKSESVGNGNDVRKEQVTPAGSEADKKVDSCSPSAIPRLRSAEEEGRLEGPAQVTEASVALRACPEERRDGAIQAVAHIEAACYHTTREQHAHLRQRLRQN